ncbi:MAG: hypothetical protein ACLP05_01175, partial [Candidatus Kryptoniota bacterium]
RSVYAVVIYRIQELIAKETGQTKNIIVNLQGVLLFAGGSILANAGRSILLSTMVQICAGSTIGTYLSCR